MLKVHFQLASSCSTESQKPVRTPTHWQFECFGEFCKYQPIVIALTFSQHHRRQQDFVVGMLLQMKANPRMRFGDGNQNIGVRAQG